MVGDGENIQAILQYYTIIYFTLITRSKKSWDGDGTRIKEDCETLGITFCPATVLRAEGQIEFDRSLDSKIRRVHFLFSCEFRESQRGFLHSRGRVDKRNRRATTPWYLGFFDGRPPSGDLLAGKYARVYICACSSTRVEYRDPSTLFKECFDEWPLCTRRVDPEVYRLVYITPPLSLIQTSFHRFQGILNFCL